MKSFLIISLLGFIGAGTALAEEAVSLRSHQATYAMKQVRTYNNRDWSVVERADGVLRYKFLKSCDGWLVEHNTAMHMDYENGEQTQMAWSYTSWEANDGSKLRFRSTTKYNGVVSDHFVGEARREDGKTVALYTEPNGRRIEMPADVFFPTAHQVKAIELAVKGETFFNAPYFDGSGEEADFDVASVMTSFKGKPLSAVDGVTLSAMPVWNVQLAFFKPDSQTSQPEIEIMARYRKDGISTKLLHDFGDFVLEGQLVELAYLDEPECE